MKSVNKYLAISIITTILWQNLSNTAYTQIPRCISINQPENNISFNTQQQNDVIIVGKIANRPYVVVIPGNSDILLNNVRNYVRDAFLAENRRGTYIHAGGFTNREEAECVSNFLRSYNLDARVVYFH